MKKSLVFAWYLPQYHRIPENDLFWGKGYTDWVAVRKAEPLFRGHNEPRIPLNNNYYDLSKIENIEWQVKLANKYGIDGFGVYHYWFNNDINLLSKPSEIIRDNKTININYFLAWDNANWKRSWSKIDGNDWSPLNESGPHKGPQVLVPYVLGTETDWENHFNYLLTHFREDRYMKIENKPVFSILQYSDEIAMMCSFWKKLAINNGFDGMYYIIKDRDGISVPNEFMKFYYQPCWSGWIHQSFVKALFNKARLVLNCDHPLTFSYDYVWRRLLKDSCNNTDNSVLYNAFVGYDDSPRRGCKGVSVTNCSPISFEKYFRAIYRLSCERDKSILFVTAWNEWGEGAYLEPDTVHKYDFLQAIKNVVSEEERI